MPCHPTDAVRAYELSWLRTIPRTLAKPLWWTLLLPMAVSADVTHYVWEGNALSASGSARWRQANNWNLNAAPKPRSAGELKKADVTIGGSLKTTPVMENPYFFRAVMFSPSAGAYPLTSKGNAAPNIGAGGIINQGANLQIIKSRGNISQSQTWNATPGPVAVQGEVSLGANYLSVEGPKAVAFTKVIASGGAINKQGASEQILADTAANAYSGGTTINDGNVSAAKANALRRGPLTAKSGALELGDYAQAVGSLTKANVAASGFKLQSGESNGRLGGSGSMVTSGVGTVMLAQPSGFGGGIFINNGTLAVNNRTGDVSINNGGSLLGSGMITGMVTNQFGGTLSAGVAVGQLSTGTEFWQGGSTLRWDILDATGAPGIGSDLLDIKGTLHINGSANNQVTLEVVSFTLGGIPGPAANFDPSQSYLWKIAQTTGGIKFAKGENETSALSLALKGFQNSFEGGTFAFSTGNDGRDLNLTYTPAVSVPEPGMLAFSALCFCGYIYGRRWKQHWRSPARHQSKRLDQPSKTAVATA